MVDPLMGTVTFTVSVVLLALSVALLITFPFALPFIWGLAVSSRAMAAVERSRVAALLGETIADPVPPLTTRSAWGRFVERGRCGPRWRELAYNLLALPRGVFTYAITAIAWW